METIQLGKEKVWKFIAIHGIAATIITALISMSIGSAYPALSGLQLNIWTGLLIVLGSGLAGLVVAHIKGNLLIIGFIGASVAVGATSILYILAGQQLASIPVLAFGNFITSMAMRYFHKG